MLNYLHMFKLSLRSSKFVNPKNFPNNLNCSHNLVKKHDKVIKHSTTITWLMKIEVSIHVILVSPSPDDPFFISIWIYHHFFPSSSATENIPHHLIIKFIHESLHISWRWRRKKTSFIATSSHPFWPEKKTFHHSKSPQTALAFFTTTVVPHHELRRRKNLWIIKSVLN